MNPVSSIQSKEALAKLEKELDNNEELELESNKPVEAHFTMDGLLDSKYNILP